MWLLNNWQCEKHAKVYGNPRAFYDLYATEHQGKRATEMKAGDACLVISQEAGKVRVDHYRLDRIYMVGDTYVMEGEHESHAVMPKQFATAHSDYKHFFNVNGAVKRVNVITR